MDSSQTTIVTGASKGIGKKIALDLLSQNHNVVLIARNKQALEQLCVEFKIEENRVLLLPYDITEKTNIDTILEKTISKFGKIDNLVCNVGSGKSEKLGNENYNEWKKMFEINFFSAVNIIEKSTNHLANTKGSIICISSICGIQIIDGAPLTYSVAKNALNFYIKGISRFLGKKGIRINGIAPGNILFEGSSWSQKIKDNKEDVYKMIKDEVPLSKFGTDEDISNLATWLLSKKASFVTGSIFVSDGGQTRI